MKTKEFIEKVENLGHTITKGDINEDYIWVRDDCYNAILGINIKEPFVLDTNYSNFKELKEEDKEQLINLAIEYIKTPLEERQDVEKYYLRLPEIFDIEWAYLNYWEEGDKYFFNDHLPKEATQTQFTQEEIDNLPNQKFIKSLIKEEV